MVRETEALLANAMVEVLRDEAAFTVSRIRALLQDPIPGFTGPCVKAVKVAV